MELMNVRLATPAMQDITVKTALRLICIAPTVSYSGTQTNLSIESRYACNTCADVLLTLAIPGMARLLLG